MDKEEKQFCVETQCQSCIFVQKKDKLWDCKLNFLSKFIEQGYVPNITLDIYRIPGKACLYWRNIDWSNNNNLNSFEQQKRKVEEEVRLKIGTVVYFGNNNTIEELLKTVRSLESGIFQPERIYILNHSEIKPSKMVTFCQTRLKTPWTIENVADRNRSLKSSLDLVYKKIKQEVYISVVKAGYVVPYDYYSKLNDIIYRDMERIIMILPQQKNYPNRLFGLRIFMKQAGYNGDDCVGEKAKRIAEKQNCSDMIKKDEEIFNE